MLYYFFGSTEHNNITNKYGHIQVCSIRGSLLARVVIYNFPPAHSIQRQEAEECRGEVGIFKIRAFKIL